MHSNQDPSAAKNKLKKKFKKLSGNRSVAGDVIASFQKYLKEAMMLY